MCISPLCSSEMTRYLRLASSTRTSSASSSRDLFDVVDKLSSALRMNPWVVLMDGWAMDCQRPGARLSVQMVIAIASIPRIAANGNDLNTSHAYQRSTMPCNGGIALAIHCG